MSVLERSIKDVRLPDGLAAVVTRVCEVFPATRTSRDSAIAIGTPIEAQPTCIARRIAEQDVVYVKHPERDIKLLGVQMPLSSYGLMPGAVHPFVPVDEVIVDEDSLAEEVYAAIEQTGHSTLYVRLPKARFIPAIEGFAKVTRSQDFYIGMRGGK